MEITPRLVHDVRLTDRELTLLAKCLALALGMPGVSVKEEEFDELENLNRDMLLKQRHAHALSLKQIDAKLERASLLTKG